MRDTLFLWPRSNAPRITDLTGNHGNLAEIESRLAGFYPNADPVMFSSARAAINAVLQHLGLTRHDFLWLPEFSSHCVLDTVGHICTPTPNMGEKVRAALVYHQWGFAHQANFPERVTILEDSVDTLFIPGSSPFSIGGRYAFWSLPKVLGTLAGGVVFCQHASDATALRRLRENRPSSMVQAALRLTSYTSKTASMYWNGAEAQQGGLIAPLRRQIWRALDDLNQTVEERIQVLKHVQGAGANAFIETGRLPSNLPIAVPPKWETIWGPQGPLTAGLRFFNRLRACPQSEWIKVAPLPIHRDISEERITKILSLLNPEDGTNEFKII